MVIGGFRLQLRSFAAVYSTEWIIYAVCITRETANREAMTLFDNRLRDFPERLLGVSLHFVRRVPSRMSCIPISESDSSSRTLLLSGYHVPARNGTHWDLIILERPMKVLSNQLNGTMGVGPAKNRKTYHAR